MDSPNTQVANSLPESPTNYWINLFCLIFFFGAMFLLHASFPRMGNVELTTICLLIVAVPLWLRDFIKERVYKRPSTGLLTQPGKINKERLVIKLIGLHGTLLIILFLYYLNPTYRISPRTAVFYNSFFYFLNLLAPWIVILSFV